MTELIAALIVLAIGAAALIVDRSRRGQVLAASIATEGSSPPIVAGVTSTSRQVRPASSLVE